MQGLLLCNEKLHTDDPYCGFKIEIDGDAEKVLQMIKISNAIGTISYMIMCSTCSFYFSTEAQAPAQLSSTSFAWHDSGAWPWPWGITLSSQAPEQPTELKFCTYFIFRCRWRSHSTFFVTAVISSQQLITAVESWWKWKSTQRAEIYHTHQLNCVHNKLILNVLKRI